MDAEYWNDRYLNNNTPWDAGTATRPIVEYFDKVTHKEARILVPGCGAGHEAAHLYRSGFPNVHLCDWAQAPLDAFAERYPDFPKDQLHCEDFFRIGGTYDYIVEQTFFCAIDPAIRLHYALHIKDLLAEEGRLVGLMFGLEFEASGPPFGGSEKEYRHLFEETGQFTIYRMEPCTNSIAPRQGSELFVEMGH